MSDPVLMIDGNPVDVMRAMVRPEDRDEESFDCWRELMESPVSWGCELTNENPSPELINALFPELNAGFRGWSRWIDGRGPKPISAGASSVIEAARSTVHPIPGRLGTREVYEDARSSLRFRQHISRAPTLSEQTNYTIRVDLPPGEMERMNQAADRIVRRMAEERETAISRIFQDLMVPAELTGREGHGGQQTTLTAESLLRLERELQGPREAMRRVHSHIFDSFVYSIMDPPDPLFVLDRAEAESFRRHWMGEPIIREQATEDPPSRFESISRFLERCLAMAMPAFLTREDLESAPESETHNAVESLELRMAVMVRRAKAKAEIARRLEAAPETETAMEHGGVTPVYERYVEGTIADVCAELNMGLEEIEEDDD